MTTASRSSTRDDGDPTEGAGQLAGEIIATALSIPIPGLSLIGSKLAQKLAEEHRRRVSKALKAAERLSGLSREGLEERIDRQPETVPMLLRLLQLAGTNGHDRLLAAMGEAYARAVTDPSRLEYEELLLISLSGLEELHVSVMASMEFKEERLTPESVAEISGMEIAAVRLVLAGLLSRSLVENPYNARGGDYYKLNESGLLVLQLIKAATAT